MQNILATVHDPDCHLVTIDSNCKWYPYHSNNNHDKRLPPHDASYNPANMMNVKSEPGTMGYDPSVTPNMSYPSPVMNGGNRGKMKAGKPLLSALSMKQEMGRYNGEPPPGK